MDTILLIARLALAGVFGFAGLAKLADRAGSRQMMLDFRLSDCRLLPGVTLTWRGDNCLGPSFH